MPTTSEAVTIERIANQGRGGWRVFVEIGNDRFSHYGPMTDGEALEVIIAVMYGQPIPYRPECHEDQAGNNDVRARCLHATHALETLTYRDHDGAIRVGFHDDEDVTDIVAPALSPFNDKE